MLLVAAPAGAKNLKAAGPDVLVGDIVSKCPPEICALAVVSSPLPGREKTVSRRDVETAIRRAGMSPAGLRIPARVRVARPSKVVADNTLKGRIAAAVEAILPEGAVIETLGALSNVEVPKAGFEVQARWPGEKEFRRRVSIPVDFFSGGRRFRTARVSALLAFETSAPVSARDLRKGETISIGDIRFKTVRLTDAPTDLLLSTQEIVGRQTASNVAEGKPFFKQSIKRIPVVREGERLALESVFGLVRVSVLGVSRQDGAVGDRIRVVTMSNNRLVWARITGPGRAMVMP